MKLFSFLLAFLTLTSCSLLKDVKNSVLGFNYNSISQGTPQEIAFAERQGSKSVVETSLGDLHLFDDGYFLIKDDKVFESSRYHFSMNSDDLLSDFVKKDEDLSSILPRLGRPKAIQERDSKVIIIYNRGVILSQNSKILSAVDNMYSDLIFKLGINSFTDESAINKEAYYIVPGSDKINPEDFQFKELKKYLTSSLAEAGLVTTNDPRKARYIVFANYGISDPKEDIKVISTPVFVPSYIPGNNYSFLGVNSNSAFMATAHSPGRWTSQYAGQRTETFKTVTYNRWLNVEAVDFNHLKKTKSMKPVWKVLTSSIGSSGDLRYVLPALSFGAGHYINRDSKRQLNVEISSSDVNGYLFEVKFNEFSGRDIASKK